MCALAIVVLRGKIAVNLQRNRFFGKAPGPLDKLEVTSSSLVAPIYVTFAE
jgi:hypothetical protein